MKSPVTVYLTNEERESFEAQAAAMGMSLSAYMRWRMNSNGSWSATNSPTGINFTWTPTTGAVEGREKK